jgi:hypothetical protein
LLLHICNQIKEHTSFIKKILVHRETQVKNAPAARVVAKEKGAGREVQHPRHFCISQMLLHTCKGEVHLLLDPAFAIHRALLLYLEPIHLQADVSLQVNSFESELCEKHI